jgi:hypothetical protein
VCFRFSSLVGAAYLELKRGVFIVCLGDADFYSGICTVNPSMSV